MHTSSGRTSYINLLVLIILNLFIYLPVITSFPGFIADDYILFSFIQNGIYHPLISDPSAQFFLFTRPVSYISLWIDYNLFADNYQLIKLVSLVYHIVLIISIYFLLLNIAKRFNLQIPSLAITLLCVLFSIHLDSLVWIYWISNRTEVLMILFYVWSILAFLKYSDTSLNKFLTYSLLFYLLSILSKQSSLHLPFIFLLVFIYHKKVGVNFNRRLIYFFSISFLLLIAFSLLNYTIYSENLQVTNNLWKKPFTFVGILLHSTIPLLSGYAYNYFILNKLTAAVLLLLLLLIISTIILSKRFNPTKILLVFFLSLIVLYPRIFAIGGNRLNSVIVLWLYIALLFYLSSIRDQLLIHVSLSVMLIFYTYSFINRSQNLFSIFEYENKNFSGLVNYLNTSGSKTLVLCSDSYDIIPNKYHYYKTGKFGLDSTIISSPIFYELVLVNHDLSLFNKNYIRCKKIGKAYQITSTDPLIYLLINKFNNNFGRFRILKKIGSGSGRGYKEILIEPVMSIENEIKNVIFFTGTRWIEIK